MRLLGKHVQVVASSNPTHVGVQGIVIADNRDTLLLDTERGEKLLHKHTLTLKTDGFIIEGKTLMGTLAERTKRKR
jgi:RNase P/RNase MRP subunit p29